MSLMLQRHASGAAVLQIPGRCRPKRNPQGSPRKTARCWMLVTTLALALSLPPSLPAQLIGTPGVPRPGRLRVQSANASHVVHLIVPLAVLVGAIAVNRILERKHDAKESKFGSTAFDSRQRFPTEKTHRARECGSTEGGTIKIKEAKAAQSAASPARN